ncbi:AraC family transcriptional regulator [Gordonibacter sp.]|uniref:helix-turn-helix transcriptional regulator n=1 Tax=Gordonibacter sp. TaxID=1968902 RepID=UPI0025BB098D|nr:AraC family transcriptional regulator [Gordonibacter sp.]
MTGKTAPLLAVAFIEEHLPTRLSLEAIAASTNYSKHHLHRRFSAEAGMTIGSYICRRRLTEAAKMLVFTDWSVLDIAVAVGFGSQQAFSAAFKRMFKKTPCQYRADEEFWPLQSRLALSSVAHHSDNLVTRFATPSDEEEWMTLLDQVVDGYPHLNEDDYVAHLRRAITCTSGSAQAAASPTW